MTRKIILKISIVVLAATIISQIGARAEEFDRAAAIVARNDAFADVVPNEYIVVLRNKGVSKSILDNPRRLGEGYTKVYGGRILHSYKYGLYGFLIQTNRDAAQELVRALKRDSRVATVTENAPLFSNTIQPVTNSWGLDRIDQRAPLSSLQSRLYGYDGAGDGVWVYVFDNGIKPHSEFENRATDYIDVIDTTNPTGYRCEEEGDADAAHGTWVAGIIGGKTFGVAKKVKLISVRIAKCNGAADDPYGRNTTTIAHIIGAINTMNYQRTLNPNRPMIANLSYGFSNCVQDDCRAVFGPLNQAIYYSMINYRVTWVVSAGNENREACLQYPANLRAMQNSEGEVIYPNAPIITVGATMQQSGRDYRWVASAGIGSNYGTCVDIFAPGKDILTSDILGDPPQSQTEGTSVAAPFVTGVAALYLERHPTATPQMVKEAILRTATIGSVGSPLIQDLPINSNSPDKLLFSRQSRADLSVKSDGSYWNIDYASDGFGQFDEAHPAYGDGSNHPVPADYDGDFKTDLSVKTDVGVWAIDYARDGFGQWNESRAGYGISNNWLAVPADYDGDFKTDLSVKVSDGRWYIDYARDGFGVWNVGYTGRGDATFRPVPADYDGDGLADLSVKADSGVWYIDYARNGFGGYEETHAGYGGATYHPVPADYDGDGKADLSIKSDAGYWYIDYAREGGFGVFNETHAGYGGATYHPVPADYDGDGKADLSIKSDAGYWYIDYASGGFGVFNETHAGYGGATYHPVPADYDGPWK